MRSTAADDERHDPDTARAVQAAREKMESLAKVTTLLNGSESHGKTKVEVFAPYGAGDLSIVDRTYALVASGVGWVQTSLPPGPYSVRHQLGDESAIDSIEVLEGQCFQGEV